MTIAESVLPVGTVVSSTIRNPGSSGAGSLPSLLTNNYDTIDAAIDIREKALKLSILTESEKNALVPYPGMIILNGDSGLFEGFDTNYQWAAIGGGGGSLTPVEVISGPVQMEVNHTYYVESASQISLNLPASAEFGDVIQVSGVGTGGFVITQDQFELLQIRLLANTTTAGDTGTLTSNNQGECVYLEWTGSIWLGTFFTGNFVLA